MTRTHWLSLSLLLSMGINIFAVGVLLSPYVQRRVAPRDHGVHHGPRGPGMHEPLMALRGVVRVMGGRKDARVRAIWQDGHAQLRARHQRLRAAQADLDQALIRVPYAEPAVRAALLKVRTEAQGIQELSGDSLLELMRQLTPEERSQLERLMEKQKDTPPKLR